MYLDSKYRARMTRIGTTEKKTPRFVTLLIEIEETGDGTTEEGTPQPQFRDTPSPSGSARSVNGLQMNSGGRNGERQREGAAAVQAALDRQNIPPSF